MSRTAGITSGKSPATDLSEVAKAVREIVSDRAVIELRVLGAVTKSSRWPHTMAGYFDDGQKLAEAVASIQQATGIYITLNPVDPRLLSRSSNRIRRAPKGESTQDSNIVRRCWLPIDLDPERPAGISSTEEEHAAALAKAKEIADALSERGWPDPIIADSGNGGHLLYAIDEPANDDGLVRHCLVALARQFDDHIVRVDTTTFNPARIWKLYGTLARKGDDTPERPHRVSRIMSLPAERQVVDHKLLESLAAEVPQAERHASSTIRHNSDAFDVPAFIERHRLDVDGPNPWSGSKGSGQKWIFGTSPMCDHDDDGPFLIQFDSGAISAGCHHNSCRNKWGWKELRAKLEPTHQREESSRHQDDGTHRVDSVRRRGLPQVRLPGGAQSITDTAATLGSLLAVKRSHFHRGGTVVCLADDAAGEVILQPRKPAEMASDFEVVARLVKLNVGRLEWSTCSEAAAKLIMSARTFVDTLPILRVLTRCSVLVERNGELVDVCGYDLESGVMAAGPAVEHVSLDDARKLLHTALDGFRFATAADKSRALAAIITPAMVAGGILGGRPPIDLGEADESQTGKGYRNKITAAIYREVPRTVTQRRSGVGGLEESFDRALISGATFIALDNIRGQVDCQSIESFVTEDTYSARCPYTPVTMIDPKRVAVMFTSNQAEMTRDLANRSSCVRLLKQPEGFQFPVYPEGNILQHVRANQPIYLGAVFAIVREWHARGRPRTGETRHDFRAWAQTLDWIVQNLLGAAPLLDGHRETQRRMTSPAMTWLRLVALAVKRRGRLDEWLKASRLLEIINAEGDIPIPGLKDDGNLEDDDTWKAVVQQMGRRLSQAFGRSDEVTIDGLLIERGHYLDAQYRERVQYRVHLEADDVVDDNPIATEAAEEPCVAPVTDPGDNVATSAVASTTDDWGEL